MQNYSPFSTAASRRDVVLGAATAAVAVGLPSAVLAQAPLKKTLPPSNHYDGIKAFSETDFTENLKSIEVPTLVMRGDDDQVVPIADSALLSVKLVQKGTLKVYESFPHGAFAIHADVINPDLLAFIKA